MERKYEWVDASEVQASLYGPGNILVAEIAIDYQAEDMSDLAWRIRSNLYDRLNLEESDTSISLTAMKQRALILLGSELDRRRRNLDKDIENILTMLVDQEAGVLPRWKAKEM